MTPNASAANIACRQLMRRFELKGTAIGQVSHSASIPYASTSSIAVGVNVRIHAIGQSANHVAKKFPATMKRPAIHTRMLAAGIQTKLIAQAIRPSAAPPKAMIGTTTAFATKPTIERSEERRVGKE